MNCIPDTIFEMKLDDYEEFLKQHRILMAEKMRLYLFGFVMWVFTLSEGAFSFLEETATSSKFG